MWTREGECPGKVCPAKISHRSYIICFVGMICIRYISYIFFMSYISCTYHTDKTQISSSKPGLDHTTDWTDSNVPIPVFICVFQFLRNTKMQRTPRLLHPLSMSECLCCLCKLFSQCPPIFFTFLLYPDITPRM